MTSKYAGLLTSRYRLLKDADNTTLDHYIYRCIFPMIGRAIMHNESCVSIKGGLIPGAHERLVSLGYTVFNGRDASNAEVTSIDWEFETDVKLSTP